VDNTARAKASNRKGGIVGSELLTGTLALFMVLLIGLSASFLPDSVAAVLATVGAIAFLVYTVWG